MAGDLRVVAALLHVIVYLERMGNQCVSIAKLIPLSGHEPPTLPDILALCLGWARSPARRCPSPKRAFTNRDVGLAEDLVRQDREVDQIEREILRRVIEVDLDDDTREWAMHMVLVARALERIGDNAVDVGEQTAFVVTGLFREFSST